MKWISPFLLLCLFFIVGSDAYAKYHSLDTKNPIAFKGTYIVYGGEKIQLGPRAFFVDGNLDEKIAEKYEYVYTSINEAVKHLKDGTEAEPMTLYIAPYVYWIDNPDDEEIRIPKPGEGIPYGLEIDCDWLFFSGLNPKPGNVVLACNRGQTMGAKGNFTMFKIVGDGTRAENLTMGNYCNIDLEYPLKPELNRKKRGSAIVQAQLAICKGDKIMARNTHFISRLNLVPMAGGERTFFDRCHFECTDDALADRGVYLDCTFGFYSSKPFAHAGATGAVLLNCDITSFTHGNQYFTKWGGQVAAVDCRMDGPQVQYWGWRALPSLDTRYYHMNNTLNGSEVEIGTLHPYASVAMDSLELQNAYRYTYRGNEVYNTYNLLRGEDEWDPMFMKETVRKAEIELGINLSSIPTQLLISPHKGKVETGMDSLLLQAQEFYFGGNVCEIEKLNWSVSPEDSGFVCLVPGENGTCRVIPTNTQDETRKVVVMAETPIGLQAASVVTVAPSFLDPPRFLQKPEISLNEGNLSVNYTLDMKFPDQSLVTWYRCTDVNGSNPVKVAVSRFNQPKYNYALSNADVGYFMKVTIEPKHLRCNVGKPVGVLYTNEITMKDVLSPVNKYVVNIEAFPTQIQPKVMPGFWTVDCFKPEDTNEYNDWAANNTEAPWYVGSGINGAANDTGLVQAHKGARLRYTPQGERFGDMKVSFTACPSKTAGQGFSSAKAQYMDIFIKFDTQNMNGYALRLFRTTKFHNAIDVTFVRYEDGKAVPISDVVSTSCYRTPCSISLEVNGNMMSASMHTTAKFPKHDAEAVLDNVDIETEIELNPFGGTGFQHTGSVGSGATLIKDLQVEWLK